MTTLADEQQRFDSTAAGQSDLGRRLSARRHALGFSVAEVAAAAGVDPGYLHHLEEQAGLPQYGTLLRLAVVLKTTVPSLLGVGSTEVA